MYQITCAGKLNYWVREVFDLSDLQEAKILLQALSKRARLQTKP